MANLLCRRVTEAMQSLKVGSRGTFGSFSTKTKCFSRFADYHGDSKINQYRLLFGHGEEMRSAFVKDLKTEKN